ncbi:MAG: hypothetical protein ACRC76_01350 [Proteocatella sp.]
MQIKNLIKLTFLTLLIFTIASYPMILSMLKNQNLINTSHVIEMNSEEFQIESTDNDNVLEKLAIIKTATTEKTGVITEQNNVQLPDEIVNNIVDSAKSEIKIMKDQHILPEFTFPSEYVVDSIIKLTFMDYDNPSNVVNVWALKINYGDFSINCLIDTEINIIYQIGISIYNKQMDIDVSQISPSSILDYFKIPKEAILESNEASITNRFYVVKNSSGIVTVGYEYHPNDILYYYIN